MSVAPQVVTLHYHATPFVSAVPAVTTEMSHHVDPSSSIQASFENNGRNVKHKRRYCRAPGCTRIVKSQGLCQRHGAKPRKCKVEGCDKQAQGNFDGMCKSHFKAHKRLTTPILPIPPMSSSSSPSLPSETAQPVAVIGCPSTHTNTAPSSAAATQAKATATNPHIQPGSLVAAANASNAALVPPPAEGQSVYDSVLPASIAWNSSMDNPMPLVKHLKDGFDGCKPPAWHRNEERRARGLFPILNPATQLEGWERELVWMEILILTGNPESSFRHLARGWGRDKGFHMVLAQFICERRGNVERKKREKLAQRSHQQHQQPTEELPESQRRAARMKEGEDAEDFDYALDYHAVISAEEHAVFTSDQHGHYHHHAHHQYTHHYAHSGQPQYIAHHPQHTHAHHHLRSDHPHHQYYHYQHHPRHQHPPHMGGNAGPESWDDAGACYGDAAYNEALAADLLNFHPPALPVDGSYPPTYGGGAVEAPPVPSPEGGKRVLDQGCSFSFDHDGDAASYDSSLISSSEDGFEEQEFAAAQEHP